VFERRTPPCDDATSGTLRPVVAVAMETTDVAKQAVTMVTHVSKCVCLVPRDELRHCTALGCLAEAEFSAKLAKTLTWRFLCAFLVFLLSIMIFTSQLPQNFVTILTVCQPFRLSASVLILPDQTSRHCVVANSSQKSFCWKFVL